ncbi:MAG: AP-4 complex subunit beta-1 [Bacillariaceae sp.]|jgi:AP-4 complex subunit beta-1
MSYPASGIHTATPVSFPSQHSHSNVGGHGGPPVGGGGPPAGGAPVPDSYFTESKKGEVNELKTLLKNFATERDPQRKRDIIKKVIAYMTLGIDVSRLFTDMMLAIETRDLVIKKMVYLYLCNYAHSHPDLAQMCTNTLQKDCGNEDPMVRGLALRSLCSLNLPQMVEYISEPLRKSLQDHHAYVRKTGVMGILKLFYLDREAFRECNFTDILYDMLRDVDPTVVANCIRVLNEVMAKSDNGGMAINRAIMLHLLNRIHEFSEFDLVVVIELVHRYIPANAEEGYQIMNLLDPVLRTSSSAAVLATVKAFLSMVDSIGSTATEIQEIKEQIVSRVKAPLITLVASGSNEGCYVMLKQVEQLVELCPRLFDDEYRQFYIRFNEPTHVKYLKVKILPLLANPDTAPDIVAELAEIVNDNNMQLSRLAIQSMAKIACRNTGGPGAAESIAQRMVDFLDLNVQHVQSEAATALTLMVRKHPDLKPVCCQSLARTLRYVEEGSGKASIIWLLGECCDIVQDAPYALEKLIDDYDNLKDIRVKQNLLNATMKIFFARPPETQRMLGRLMIKVTDDVSSQDLHDRGLLYYRLLKSGADPKSILAHIVSNSKSTIPGEILFTEEDDKELRAELMQEFDSLAIIYGKTAVNFIKPEYQVVFKKMPLDHPLDATSAPGAIDYVQVPVAPQNMPQPNVVVDHAAAAPQDNMIGDLLGFDTPSPVIAAPPPATASTSHIAWVMGANMSGDDYQTKWGAISDADAIVEMVNLQAIPSSTNAIEAALSSIGVSTMASGEMPNEFKLFLYALEEGGDGCTVLIQSNISKESEPLMILTVKVENSDGSAPQHNASQKVNSLIPLIKRALTSV